MSVNQKNVCLFCQSSFTRNDALKRHWNTCSARRDASMDIPKIPSKTRGRRLKACDQCSSMKRACISQSQQQSCELCTTKKITCSYRRFSRKISDRRDRLATRASEPNHSKETMDLELSMNYIDEEEPASHSLISTCQSIDGPIFSPDEPGPSWLSEFNWLNYDFTRNFNMEYTLTSSYNRQPTDIRISTATSLSFFRRMTQAIGLASTFECGTPADRSTICQHALQLSVHRSTSHMSFGSSLNNMTSPLDRQQLIRSSIRSQYQPLMEADTKSPSFLSCDVQPPTVYSDRWSDQVVFSSELAAQDEASGLSPYASPLSPFLLDGISSCLSFRCQHIINRLRDATLQKPQRSIISTSWSQSLEKVCLKLFTATNAERFLALFWSSWYPNWPTIHQPTFDPMNAHLDLVITMMLMGACLSPNQLDRSMASIWFDTIEELIFSANDFSSNNYEEMHAENSMNLSTDRLGILQAAYCICLLQTWEGSRESKRRIRRHRYNSLIWLARDTGLEYATLKSVSTEEVASFDWEDFVLKESFIRIVTYIYNLDSAYAMFCSQPPQILYNELQIDLTAPEACFQANSSEECFVLLKAWRITFGPDGISSLSVAVQMICSDRMSRSDALFSYMSVLNMFTIIHVLYAITFQVENSLMLVMDTTSLQKGLENWRNLWPSPSRDEELSLGYGELDNSSINRTGFTQHAPEIWFLAHSSLGQAVAKRGTYSTVNDKTASDGTGMAHLTSMVNRFRIEKS